MKTYYHLQTRLRDNLIEWKGKLLKTWNNDYIILGLYYNQVT